MNTLPAVQTTPSVGRLAIPLALAAVYLIWGSTYLAIRFALEGGFPPFLLGGARFLLAGALMFAFLRLRRVAMPTWPQWCNAGATGMLLLIMGNGMVNYAEQTVSSGTAAVGVASAPLWMALFAMLRGERPSRIEWLGLAVGFVGVVWLNAGSSLKSSPAGLVALLIAPLCWAFGSIWSRGRDLPSPVMTAAVQMLVAGAGMTAIGLLLGEHLPAAPSRAGMEAFAYLVVMGSIVGFSAYVWLLRNVRPALASSYAYVNPAIAVLLGALFARERFGVGELTAMGVILLGVLAITLARAFKPKPAARDEPEPDA